MSTRYATIIKDNDGNEIVSNIAQVEGNPSQPGGNARLVKVGDGVKIGDVYKGGAKAEAKKADPEKAE